MPLGSQLSIFCQIEGSKLVLRHTDYCHFSQTLLTQGISTEQVQKKLYLPFILSQT